MFYPELVGVPLAILVGALTAPVGSQLIRRCRVRSFKFERSCIAFSFVDS